MLNDIGVTMKLRKILSLLFIICMLFTAVVPVIAVTPEEAAAAQEEAEKKCRTSPAAPAAIKLHKTENITFLSGIKNTKLLPKA